jgi:hypothetical protein
MLMRWTGLYKQSTATAGRSTTTLTWRRPLSVSRSVMRSWMNALTAFSAYTYLYIAIPIDKRLVCQSNGFLMTYFMKKALLGPFGDE